MVPNIEYPLMGKWVYDSELELSLKQNSNNDSDDITASTVLYYPTHKRLGKVAHFKSS